MPRLFESIAGDLALRRRLRRFSKELAARSDEDQQRDYVAWRWLGERSPWMSYLVAFPRFAVLRVGVDVHVAWDNSEVVIEGLKVWTAESGVLVLSVEAFLAECRSFADRLLASMGDRDRRDRSGRGPALRCDGRERSPRTAWNLDTRARRVLQEPYA